MQIGTTIVSSPSAVMGSAELYTVPMDNNTTVFEAEARRRARAKARGCRRVSTPNGTRYMKNGRFVKRSRC